MNATLSALFLFLFLFTGVSGQSESIDIWGTSNLYKIEAELLAGDKNALSKLGEFFDSETKIVDFLGYHRIETTEGKVAKRMVQDNSVFTTEEITVSRKTTKKQFIDFLKRNDSKLVFSKDAGAFLITPFENRTVEFEVLDISQSKKAELIKKRDDLLKLDWVKEDGIGTLIETRNPQALLKIALHLFRTRDRWNRYYYNEDNDLGLLEYLTGTQIVVKNENDQFSHHIGSDYSPVSKLNLLIFFAKFYKDYTFDGEKNAFVNSKLRIGSKSKERILFEALFSEDSEKALKAFIELTELDPAVVGILADEFNRANSLSRANSTLPIFTFSFLKQLSLLTEYCRKNGIDYKGSEKVRFYVESLKKEMTIAERYRLENQIIGELSLKEITAFEYWSLIYQTDWELTYSAGRIVDKALGRNWIELVADDKSLSLYLKKSKLYDQLGIIGVVNKYLDKFISAPQPVIARLKALKTSEKDVSEQLAAAITKASEQVKEQDSDEEEVNVPTDLESQLKRFAGIRFLNDEEKKELVTLLSRISYEQIRLTVTYLEKISFIEPSKFDSKYEFLTNDWGFDLVGDFDNEDVRKEFVANYLKMSQSELYSFYLARNGFDFQKPDNTLDFDKIYEMLKYDVVEAFAGGGGGRREDHVYSLIKLLENRFRTTLGYMNKLCMSENVQSCSNLDRAKKWILYLKENKHLEREHNEPTSFTYRD